MAQTDYEEFDKGDQDQDKDQVKFETDFVNEDVTTRENILKEPEHEGFFNEDPAVPQSTERGVKNEAHFENVLYEESIKGFLDAGISNHKTEKWDGPKSKLSPNCETIQQGLGPQKLEDQNGKDNEYGVVDPQKLKGNISVDKTKSKK